MWKATLVMLHYLQNFSETFGGPKKFFEKTAANSSLKNLQ